MTVYNCFLFLTEYFSKLLSKLNYFVRNVKSFGNCLILNVKVCFKTRFLKYDFLKESLNRYSKGLVILKVNYY